MDEVHFEKDIGLLFSRSHSDPHRYLGLHNYDRVNNIIRIFAPYTEKIPYIKIGKSLFLPKRSKKNSLFFYLVPKWISFNEYTVFFNNDFSHFDPYAFPKNWTGEDSLLFEQGNYFSVYNKLGAHIINFHGVLGTLFAVWAPNVRSVSVIGYFNEWNPLCHQLRRVSHLGIWEIFLPENLQGALYKWSFLTCKGESLIKSDPYGFQFENPSSSSSRIVNFNNFIWRDESWREKQKQLNSYKNHPLNIYEVHLGSWKKSNDREFLNYRELAHELVRYCTIKNYTHVEILPITEHPLFESWGYQVLGFYSPTLRYGTLQDFQYFVNYMHVNNLGVILDWVPGHFPLDKDFLSCFDGSYLYENKEQGIHPYWKTSYFNYDNGGVINFLIGSALFWCKEMHVDGLRIDAVDSMINLDFGKEEGSWVSNHLGGKENLPAIKFLKKLNKILHEEIPGVITIAEDSSDVCYVTRSIDKGGLGFDYKWNMGWVHDSLKYFEKPISERSRYYSLITFGIMYSLEERFILSLSHDECSNGKQSLLSRMPGNKLNKIANLKVFLIYFFCFPGKKTLFMTNDILHEDPWSVGKSLPWDRLQTIENKQFETFIRSLNNLYMQEDNFWRDDTSFNGFSWLICDEIKNGIIVFKRCYEFGHSYLICVFNFSNICFYNYKITLDTSVSKCKEIFSSDNLLFGGSGQKNFNILSLNEDGYVLNINIFRLSSIIFKIYK